MPAPARAAFPEQPVRDVRGALHQVRGRLPDRAASGDVTPSPTGVAFVASSADLVGRATASAVRLVGALRAGARPVDTYAYTAHRPHRTGRTPAAIA